MTTPIVETPVTGIPGKRTPRDQIRAVTEMPVTKGKKLEPIWIGDISGSNVEDADPEGTMSKIQLVAGFLPLYVGAIESDDAEAKREQASGSSTRGGLRAWVFNEPGEVRFEEGEDESDDYRDLRDLNSANVLAALQALEYQGRTYIMPVIRAAEHAFITEFGDDPDRMAEYLITTDGKLSDPKEFEHWLASVGDRAVVAVAVYGYGDGHDEAVRHYQDQAAKNDHLTVIALSGVSDPMEVAYDLRVLSGAVPSGS